MKTGTICALLLATAVLLSMIPVSMAQTSQFGGYGQAPQAGYQQQYPGQYQAQQPAGQYGQQPYAPQPGVLNIPPAPQKATPNMQYGNTERAALIAEQLSQASQGNANVYLSESPQDRSITASVYMKTDGDPYSLSGTMANLTYMLSSIYGITELKGADIFLKVYDSQGQLITDAKFSDAKNAFEYYEVPQAARPVQPAYPQPGVQQPGYGQPGMQMPSFPQTGMQQPGFGQQQQQPFGQQSSMGGLQMANR